MRPRTIESSCRRCSEKFSTTIRGAGRPPLFCSDACRVDARRNPNRKIRTRVCAICGQTFETTKSSECCSRPCGQKLAKQRSDAARKANAEERRRRLCVSCGAVFVMRNPSGRARRGEAREGRFCSRRCRDMAATRRPAQQLDLFSS